MIDEEKRDCHYCASAECSDENDKSVMCWFDIDDPIYDCKKTAERCQFFNYADYFPKT